jgi:hypothetical protein
MMEYNGSCFCGAVEFSLKGEPLFTQYCHCNKCRDIAAESNNIADKVSYSFTAAYLTTLFSIIRGCDQLESEARNTSNLFLCKNCKSLIYGISQDPTKQAGIGININNIKFSNNTLPETFKPDKHIWYQERIKDIHDGLPKYKDAPIEQFGSGELFL